MSPVKLLAAGLPFLLLPALLAQPVRPFSALPEGDVILDMATDPEGNALIAGVFFPTIRKSAGDASDAFVAKVSADGELVFRRVYAGGGAETASAVATDGEGAVYAALVTSSASLRGTLGALQLRRGSDAYQTLLIKLDRQGVPIYETYIGGTSNTSPAGLAVNSAGEAVVSGQTVGGELPTTPGAAVSSTTVNTTFVAKVDRDGSELLFGVRGIGGGPVAVDPQGAIYIGGAERGNPEVPVSSGAFQSTHEVRACGGTGWFGIPCSYGYVVKLNPDGTQVLFATYLTGSFGSSIAAVSIGEDGAVLAAGSTNSPDFPTTPGALLETYVAAKPRPPIPITPHIPVYPPAESGFVAELSADGTELLFSTYWSGTVQDSITGMRRSERSIELAGVAESPDIPGLSAPAPCLPSAYVAEIAADGSAVFSTTLLNRDAGPRIDRRGLRLLAAAGRELLEVDFDAPRPEIACILDSATFARVDSVAPGSLVSLFGDELAGQTLTAQTGPNGLLPTTLGGLSLLVGEQAAPLLYVSPGQVNAQIPFEAEPGTSAAVRLAYTVTTGEDPLDFQAPEVAVEARRPAVFVSPLRELECPQLQVFPAAGVSPLALNEDGSVVSCATPLRPGSTATLFLTGVGRTEPQPATGTSFVEPAIPLDAPVSLGRAEVLSATSLPGSVSSVWQVTFRVPGDAEGVLLLEPEVDGTPAAPERVFLWVGRWQERQ